jgi:glutaminyl-tRNA synthetase
MATADPSTSTDFIRQAITEDTQSDRFAGRVHTRFPPEPNGYLHIGHATSICLNFGIAKDFDGLCNLRYDDTNPAKEEEEYVESQRKDIHWLGFDWGDREFYASDYFDQIYEYAQKLIREGKAYVDSLSQDEMREHRGTLTKPGTDSPHRNRSAEENLDMLERMKQGEFEEGEAVLRAKIDMASPNLNLRDPVLYRIIKTSHIRTGDKWCIYPMYDFAHGQSDSLEGITHSLCTMEYEDHRPLYDWFLDELGLYHPRQIEFARINLSHTMLSKRMLLQLVNEGHVSGWTDPRMPTLAGMRRRGYPPEAIRDFCDTIGVTKNNAITGIAVLQHCVRDRLNRTSQRVMGVLNPLKVVIENMQEGEVDWLDAINNPEDPEAGSRKVPFSRELYIEQDDFMEDPPRKFFRLGPGREVRLRYGYFIKCESVVKDDAGNITELRCTYDPETRGGSAPDGRKVKATLHWVSASHAINAEVRLYDHLFTEWDPTDAPKGLDWKDSMNPEALVTTSEAKLEPSLADAVPGTKYQFERLGYFVVDSEDSTPEHLVFNRTVTLRDTWARVQQAGKK